MPLTEQDLDSLIRDRAIRLLVLSSGKRIWEASPSPLHQMIVDEIRATIQPAGAETAGGVDCAGRHLADVYIRLPDGSLVRPDISIFCSRPPRQRQALTLVPPAVIEVVSPNYETKDLEDLPPIYTGKWRAGCTGRRCRPAPGYTFSWCGQQKFCDAAHAGSAMWLPLHV